MQVLWANGRVNARDLTDTLNLREPIAHSTVQTLLRKLEAKGAVGHEKEDRTFIYRALIAADEVAESVTHDVLSRIFGGSVSGLVSHLLKYENVSREDLEELRKLVNDAPDNGEHPKP